jgi:hypothetical protein
MPAGNDNVGSATFTLTGYAQLRMAGPGGASMCPAPNMGASASLYAVRAHVTLPFVTWQ